MSESDDDHIREILIDREFSAGEIAVLLVWLFVLGALAWVSC